MCVISSVILVSLWPALLIKGTLEQFAIYRKDLQIFLVKKDVEKLWTNDVMDYKKTVSSKHRRNITSNLSGISSYDFCDDNGDKIQLLDVSILQTAVENQGFPMEKTKCLLDKASGDELSLKNCENLKGGKVLGNLKTDDWEWIGDGFGHCLNRVLFDLSQVEGVRNATLDSIKNCDDLYEKLPPVFKNFLDASTANLNYTDDNKNERRSKAASAMIKARNKNFLNGHQLQENLTNAVVTTSKVSSIIMSRQGPGGSAETVRKLLRSVHPPPPPPPSLTLEGFDNTQYGNRGADDVLGQDRMYMSVAASHVSVEVSKSPDLAYNENLFPSKWLLPTLKTPTPELLEKLKLKKECDSVIMRDSLARYADMELKRLEEQSESPDQSQSSASSATPAASPFPSQSLSQKSVAVSQTIAPSTEKSVSNTQTSTSSQHSLHAEQMIEDVDQNRMDFQSELSLACKEGDVIAVKRLLKEPGDHNLDEAIDAACMGGNREVVEELCVKGASVQNHLFYVAHLPGSICVIDQFYKLHIPSKRLDGEAYQPRYFNPVDPEKRKKLNGETRRGASYNHVESNFESVERPTIRVNNIIATSPDSKEKLAALLRVLMKRKGYYVKEQLILPACDGLPLSQLLDLQQNTYKCVCGLSIYGLELFKSHFQEKHPDLDLTAPEEFLEFKNVLFIGGAGHYYMNAMRGFADLIWDPLLKKFVESLNWETRNQLAVMHRMGNTHLANQTLLCCLHGALFRKLVQDYQSYAEKQGLSPDGEHFVEWLQLEELDDHTRFEINCLLTLHGMTVFLEGLRRNNMDHFFAGISFFNFIWFVRNHPIYRQLDLYLSILREISPLYVFVVLFVHLSWSWTGEPTSGEHIDFVVENVNKQLKQILPQGQVTIQDWSDACLSCDSVYNIKKEVFSRLGIKNLESDDKIHDYSYFEEQLPKLVQTLREIHDVNKCELTYPTDLANFRNVGVSYRNSAISDLAMGIVAMRTSKTTYIPGSKEEEDYFASVDSMTIEAVCNAISETIQNVECRRQQRQLSIKYDNHKKTTGGKGLASLRKFLLDLREQLKTASDDKDNA